MSDALQVDELIRLAGDPDLGPPDFRVALDRLVDALNGEAELGPQRVANTTLQLVAALATRARITAALRARPDAGELPIEAPIVIVGFPRTGTTLLQNLLASHPEHRSFPLWELRAPVTPPDAGPDFRSEQIAQTQGWLDLLLQLAPDFAAMWDWPEDAWREFIADLRQEHRIRHDDTTLVLLRIVADAPPPSSSSTQALDRVKESATSWLRRISPGG